MIPLNMHVDLSNISIRIYPHLYVGEIVFRTATIDLVGQPPLVIARREKESADEYGDDLRLTLSGSVKPFPEEDAPLTAQLVDFRLPLMAENYLVTSWGYEADGLFVAYVLCVLQLEDGTWSVGINNEGDLETRIDGISYRDTKEEAFSAEYDYALACLQIPLN
jgi:hypothetical protein